MSVSGYNGRVLCGVTEDIFISNKKGLSSDNPFSMMNINYSASIAPVGHVPAQAPQSTQASASIS